MPKKIITAVTLMRMARALLARSGAEAAAPARRLQTLIDDTEALPSFDRPSTAGASGYSYPRPQSIDTTIGPVRDS